MEVINKIDSNIDSILDNDAFYTVILVILIVFCTFNTGSYELDKPNKQFINFNIPLIKILFILLIVYFSTKDIRISLLLMIIFFVETDKIHLQETHGELIALLVNDKNLEERILALEKHK
jgi:hypothetical protein